MENEVEITVEALPNADDETMTVVYFKAEWVDLEYDSRGLRLAPGQRAVRFEMGDVYAQGGHTFDVPEAFVKDLVEVLQRRTDTPFAMSIFAPMGVLDKPST